MIAYVIAHVECAHCLSSVLQEGRKQRSGRSPNEDSKDDADKKRGIFFSWSRNRSFGKGPKKKEIGDVNLGEKWINNPSGIKDPCCCVPQQDTITLVAPADAVKCTVMSRDTWEDTYPNNDS